VVDAGVDVPAEDSDDFDDFDDFDEESAGFDEESDEPAVSFAAGDSAGVPFARLSVR
jgi:hypothetical protein